MKPTRYLLILALGFWYSSCGEKQIPIPLSQDKMVDVLVDVHLAEAMLEKLPLTDQDTVGHVYYRMIFRQHDITQEDFDQSMSVLREDAKRLNTIYEKIQDRLNEMEATARGNDKMEE